MNQSDAGQLTAESVRALIERNAAEHKTVSEEDSWHYEALERDTLVAIFEYCLLLGIQFEGYDLRKMLDAEDDEDEGVPPEGVEQALYALQARMTEPDSPNPIPVPAEVRDLFKYYEKTFWPEL